MTRKKRIALQEATKVLGSFDPLTFLIKLHIEPSDIPFFRSDPHRILRKIPVNVIAHELSHFFQSAATSHGLRTFSFWCDALTLKFHIINEVTKMHDGTLKVPILANLPPTAELSYDLMKNIFDYTRVISRQLYHCGGWHMNSTKLSSARKISSSLYHMPYSFLNHKIPLLLADLSGVNKQPIATVFGGYQICEGYSNAIDLIQSRLAKSGVHRAYHPDDKDPCKIGFNDAKPLFDPYYLSNSLYSSIVNLLPGCERDSSLEEFIAISDLALMGDNWILNYKNWMSNQDLKNLQQLELLDVSPAVTYIHLLGTFADSWKKLPRLGGNYSQQAVYDFQNSLIELAGGVSLKQISMTCESFIDDFFPRYREGAVIPTTVFNLFQNIYSEAFRFRRDALHHSALIIDLLMSKEDIYNFFLMFVPAFIFGDKVLSLEKGYSPGEGIGVDLSRLQQMHYITDLFMLGDDACPLHADVPRVCSIQPSSFCKAMYNNNHHNPNCVRAMVLSSLMTSFNIKKLIVPT